MLDTDGQRKMPCYCTLLIICHVLLLGSPNNYFKIWYIKILLRAWSRNGHHKEWKKWEKGKRVLLWYV